MEREDRYPVLQDGARPSLRVFSVGLRTGALAAKFLSIFFIARFLTPADFGMFGLVAAAVSYSTYLVGADFYIFSNRELIRTPVERQGAILTGQGAASVVSYLVAAPLFAAAFHFGFLPWSLFGWFLILLVIEHLSQESNRLLVALGHPGIAAVVLFLRAGLWPLVVIPLLWWRQETRHLSFVLGCWAASAGLALALAMVVIRGKRLGGWQSGVDWAWIRRGFGIAASFLLGSLALRGLFTVDRFWIDTVATPEVLGAYIFFMAIAGALPALLDAGLFAFEYPAMVATYAAMSVQERCHHIRRLLVQVVGLSLAYSLLVAMLLPLGLEVANRPEYAGHLVFLAGGVVAMSLYVASLVPHFALYALDEDKAIVTGNVLAFLVFFPATLALRRVVSTEAAIPGGLITAFLFLFSWKTIALRRWLACHPRHRAEI